MAHNRHKCARAFLCMETQEGAGMLTFSDFLNQMAANPVFAVTAALTLAVIFVNGWTDAPNAIATCVATGAMEMNEPSEWQPFATLRACW